MMRPLCLTCKRAPKRSIHSPPGAPPRSPCLLLRFWQGTEDDPDTPRGNAWLTHFTDAECDEMHAHSVSAHCYQEGEAETCSAHIEVTR